MPSFSPISDNEPRHTLQCVGEITEKSAAQLIREIKRWRAGRCQIRLILDSPGGSVSATERLVECIREQGKWLDVLVTGKAHSSAVCLVAACRGGRWASKNATFILHRVSSTDPGVYTDRHGRFTASAARDAMADLRRADRLLVAELAKDFAADASEIERLVSGSHGLGSKLTAAAMMERGFLDRVW